MTAIETLNALSTDQFTSLVSKYKTKSGMLVALGFDAKYTKARVHLNAMFVKHSIVHDKCSKRRTYTADELTAAFTTAQCWSDVFRTLHMSIAGHNKKTILIFALANKISVPIFDSKSTMQRGSRIRYTFDQIYCEHSTFARSGLSGKTRTLKLFPFVCAECGNSGTYNGKHLSLELDHKNGIHDDNRIDNLRWLCPNCHSQTDTYRGKNIKSK